MFQTNAQRRPTAPQLALTRRLVALLLGAALLTFLSTAALADPGDEQLSASLRRAMEAYDILALDDAVKEIEGAIAMADRLGNTASPKRLELHIFHGIVLHALGDSAAASAAFQAALSIDRDAQIFEDYASPDLTGLLEAERARLPREVIADPIEPVVTARKLNHTPPSRASAGEPLLFEAEVPATVPVYRVLLHHRRFGETSFKDTEMTPKGETRFFSTLGGEHICSAQIDYYIEALDRTGNILSTDGDRNSPRSVPVLGAKGRCGEIIVDNGGQVEDPARQYVFFQLGAGGGAGLVTGNSTPLINKDANVDPGLSIAPFHLMAELGFMITDTFHISGLFRGQLVFLTDGVELEPIFGGKLRYWFDNEGDFVMYATVGGGHGFVRHLIQVQQNTPAGPIAFTDTIRHGPIHTGAGFGFGYQANRNIALLVDTYTLVLFPETSANVDLNLTLRVAF